MIKVQDNDRWKQVFDRVLRSSRYDLPDRRVEAYMASSFDFIVEYLASGSGSRPRALDPVGALNLRIAKKLRRAGMAEGGGDDPEFLDQLANRFFPFPEGPLIYWPKAQGPEAAGLLKGGPAVRQVGPASQPDPEPPAPDTAGTESDPDPVKR
jgi:hypothetical protein